MKSKQVIKIHYNSVGSVAILHTCFHSGILKAIVKTAACGFTCVFVCVSTNYSYSIETGKEMMRYTQFSLLGGKCQPYTWFKVVLSWHSQSYLPGKEFFSEPPELQSCRFLVLKGTMSLFWILRVKKNLIYLEIPSVF